MTTEIRFYHLMRQSPEQAVPALVEKAMETGKRMMMRVPHAKMVDFFAAALWSHGTSSFIAHGTVKDGAEAQQPLWVCEDGDNVNAAKILICVNGADLIDESDFDLCCYVFDGNDQSATEKARSIWKSYKDSNFTLTYWQQGERGWEKKA